MTDFEAIRQRKSRRAYSGALTGAQQRRLEALTADARLQSGLAFSLVPNGADAFGSLGSSYGLFTGVRAFIAISGHSPGAGDMERAGHCGQRLVLEATKLGLGTCWVGGTFSKERVQSVLPAGHSLIIVITVGPVREKQGLVEKTVRGATHLRSRGAKALYTADAEPPAWFLSGVEAAALAPSALNRQPVRFAWKDGAATALVPDIAGHQYIDLGIAKLHFEIAAGGQFAPGSPALFERD